MLLKGVRVVDFSRILVGAYCSMILSDYGAEVIKVESLEGDETRKWGPPFKDTDSAYFLSINRNKKSISLDLRKKQSIDIIKRIASKSDIFIENNIPGKTTAQGLGYDEIKKINESIIYASVSSFSEKGPLAKHPGFDLSIQAFTGLMNITGDSNGSPYKVGYPVCDILTGIHLNSGIMAALLHKEKTGEGQYIKTSLLEVNLFSMVNVVSAWLNSGVCMERKGNDHPSISPYGIFRLNSGKYIALAVATDNQFKRLLSFLTNDQMFFEKYKNNKIRLEKREELKLEIQEKINSFEDELFLKNLEIYEIPFSKINNMRDVFESDQLKEMDFVKKVLSEKYGDLYYPKHPLKFNNLQINEPNEPPLLGENSSQILKDILSLNEGEINQLINDKIIFQNPKNL